MAHLALRFRVPVSVEEEFQGFMMAHATVDGIEEAAGETLFYVPNGSWSEDDQHVLDAFLKSRTEIRLLGSEVIEDRDWNAEWEASIEPERVTDRLVITPSWHKARASELGAEQMIVIDPKMSFGTGHHETTRLCLRALETIDCKNKTVLDLGTGTGVLGMYALMLGATHAVGVDTDRWSIENAEENRGLNNITSKQFEIRSGTLQSAVLPNETFDIILANIHRNVLIEIAPIIFEHARADVILSGLLIYDADDVRSVYERAGFTFTQQSQENEWTCIRLKK